MEPLNRGRWPDDRFRALSLPSKCILEAGNRIPKRQRRAAVAGIVCFFDPIPGLESDLAVKSDRDLEVLREPTIRGSVLVRLVPSVADDLGIGRDCFAFDKAAAIGLDGEVAKVDKCVWPAPIEWSGFNLMHGRLHDHA